MPFSDTFFQDLKTLSKEEWLQERVDEYSDMTSVYHRSAIAGLVAGYSEVEPNLELSAQEVEDFKKQLVKIIDMLVPLAKTVRGMPSVTDETRVQTHLLSTLRDDIDAACYAVRNSYQMCEETRKLLMNVDEEVGKLFEDIDIRKLRFEDPRLNTEGKFTKWMAVQLGGEEKSE